MEISNMQSKKNYKNNGIHTIKKHKQHQPPQVIPPQNHIRQQTFPLHVARITHHKPQML